MVKFHARDDLIKPSTSFPVCVDGLLHFIHTPVFLWFEGLFLSDWHYCDSILLIKILEGSITGWITDMFNGWVQFSLLV